MGGNKGQLLLVNDLPMAQWVSYLTFELTTWWLVNLCLSCDSIPTYVMHNDRSREVNPEYTHCNPPLTAAIVRG